MADYQVVFTHIPPEDLPDLEGFPTGASLRHMERIKKGDKIRNPVCFRQQAGVLECIDRPSRIWMAKTAGVPLPVFVSDFEGIWVGEIIEDTEMALKHITDPTVWGPNFEPDGMRYRAP